jgi:hypothetical protein
MTRAWIIALGALAVTTRAPDELPPLSPCVAKLPARISDAGLYSDAKLRDSRTISVRTRDELWSDGEPSGNGPRGIGAQRREATYRHRAPRDGRDPRTLPASRPKPAAF